MTQIRLKYINKFPDRHGKWRHYYRDPVTQKRTPLPGRPGSPEYMAAYNAAIEGSAASKKSAVGSGRTLAGSIGAAIAGFYGHEMFTALAPTSRAARRQALEAFRNLHGSKPIGSLQKQHILSITAQMKPHAARSLLNSLKAVMQFAKASGMIQNDPTTSLKAPTVKTGKALQLERGRHRDLSLSSCVRHDGAGCP